MTTVYCGATTLAATGWKMEINPHKCKIDAGKVMIIGEILFGRFIDYRWS
jgi:hypothetical protein